MSSPPTEKQPTIRLGEPNRLVIEQLEDGNIGTFVGRITQQLDGTWLYDTCLTGPLSDRRNEYFASPDDCADKLAGELDNRPYVGNEGRRLYTADHCIGDAWKLDNGNWYYDASFQPTVPKNVAAFHMYEWSSLVMLLVDIGNEWDKAQAAAA